MVELKGCPCGKVPEALVIEGQNRQKWQHVAGTCCGTWEVEFRTSYYPNGSPELMELAIAAWNDAPREGR